MPPKKRGYSPAPQVQPPRPSERLPIPPQPPTGSLEQLLQQGKLPRFLTNYEIDKYGLSPELLRQLGWTPRRLTSSQRVALQQSDPSRQWGAIGILPEQPQTPPPTPTTLPDTYMAQQRRAAQPDYADLFTRAFLNNPPPPPEFVEEMKPDVDYATWTTKEQRRMALTYAREQARRHTGAPAGAPEVEFPSDWMKAGEAPLTSSYKDRMEEWRATDYKNQVFGENNRTLGPNGDPLPYGALGWDYNGNPYYGDGLKGWLREFTSKLTAPFSEDRQQIITTSPATAASQEGLFTRQTIIPDIGAIWGNIEKSAALGRVPAYTLRGLNAVGGLLLRGLIEIGNVPERLAGVYEELEAKGEGSFLPNITDWAKQKPFSPDLTDEEFEKLPWYQKALYRIDHESVKATAWTESAVQLLTAPYTVLRFLTSPGLKQAWEDPETYYNDLKLAWASGAIQYTASFVPMAQEEFRRRLRAGESPYLLEQELQDPLAEFFGEILLDPLNLIDFWNPLRAGQEIKALSRFDELRSVDPAIAKVFAKGFDDLGDAEALGEAQKVIETVKNAYASRLERFANLSSPPQHLFDLRYLTSGGQQFIVTQQTSRFLNTVLANAGSSDEAIDMIRAMSKLGGDTEEIMDAISTFRRFSAPQLFLSDAGLDSAIVIRTMLGDHPESFVKRLNEAMNGVENIPSKRLAAAAKFAADELRKTTAAMFPPLAKRMDDANMPWSVKAVVKLEERMRKFVTPINTFFSGVYLGLSPAYAMRNAFTNFVHVLVDEGATAAFMLPRRAADEMQKWLGGVIAPGARGFGRGALGADIAEGKVLDVLKLGPMGWSEKFEEFAALQVTSAAVRRTMEKMLKPGRAIPSLDGLIDAGLSHEAAQTLSKLIVQNYGDVDAALRAFYDFNKAGAVPILDTISWLSDREYHALQELGIADDVIKIVREARPAGKTIEDTLKELDELRQNLRRIAQRTRDEVRGVPLQYFDEAIGAAIPTEGAEIYQSLGAAARSGDISEEIVNYAADAINANQQALSSMRQVMREWFAVYRQSNDVDEQTLQHVMKLISNDTPEYMQAASFQKERQQITVRIRDWVLERAEPPPGWTMQQEWKNLGLPGDAPTTKQEFLRRLWEDFYFAPTRSHWDMYRDWLNEEMLRVLDKFPAPGSERSIAIAQQRFIEAKAFSLINNRDRAGYYRLAALQANDNAAYARASAHIYGIPTAIGMPGETAIPLDRTLLRIINNHLDEGAAAFDRLEDVPPQVVDESLRRWWAERTGFDYRPLPEAAAAQAIENAQPISEAPLPIPDYPPMPAGQAPTDARVIAESIRQIDRLFAEIKQKVRRNWYRSVPVQMGRRVVSALESWAGEARQRIAIARHIAQETADAARKFTLLNYPEKGGLDVALGYLYPFQFWYNRTYQNWLRRIISHPGLMVAYAEYRDYMAQVHAGAPEWWKYNVSVHELLGIETDNPLFFNLEATLNPLNGLTGVDFYDPRKRINWWTAFIDDMNKFGPSLWTPIQWAVAVSLAALGEQDAAQRWAGRAIPITSNIKNMLSAFGVNISPFGGVNEFDPMILAFHGGYDPYERRRIGRMLAIMVQEGRITQAEAGEAAWMQSGPIWQEAAEMAVRQRAGNPLLAVSNFMLGVGFKPRTMTDMQIDIFDQEYRRLWAMRPDLSPEEFRNLMDDLRRKYPFMDVVILSRKTGLERDRQYAYNVLGRIPPGQIDDVFKLYGLDPKFASQFYDTKGALEKWSETDRRRFMAAIVDIGAVLDMPDDATRQEWNAARSAYEAMQRQMKAIYGSDIQTKLSIFYALPPEDRDAYLALNPDVEGALTFESRAKATDPLLMQYYGSMEKIERYYRGLMYDEIKRQMGEDVFERMDELWNGYNEAKLMGSKATREYWDAHPELQQYVDLKDKYERIINQAILRAGEKLRRPTFPPLRGVGESIGAAALYAGLQEGAEASVYDMGWRDFQKYMSATLQRLVIDHIFGGKPLSYAARQQLDRIAEELGVSLQMLLDLIERSVAP